MKRTFLLLCTLLLTSLQTGAAPLYVPTPQEISAATQKLSRTYYQAVGSLIAEGPAEFGVTLLGAIFEINHDLGVLPSEDPLAELLTASQRWGEHALRADLQAMDTVYKSIMDRTDGRDPVELGIEILSSIEDRTERNRAIDITLKSIEDLVQGYESMLQVAKAKPGYGLNPETLQASIDKLPDARTIQKILSLKTEFALMTPICHSKMTN